MQWRIKDLFGAPFFMGFNVVALIFLLGFSKIYYKYQTERRTL